MSDGDGAANAHAPPSVRRRHVFFLSGFDPKGASYYHGLYAAEAAKRAAMGDVDITVSARRRAGAGNSSWSVNQQPGPAATPALQDAAPPCETVYEYLRWDDIVRQHWPRTMPRLLADTLFGFSIFIPCGAIGRMSQMAPATGRTGTIMGLMVPVLVLASALLGLLAGWLAAVLGGGALVGMVVGLAVLVLGFQATKTVEKRLNPSWMSRIVAFVAKLSHGRVPEAEGRLDAMAATIASRLRDPSVDEVLVVGYSVGSILAVSAVARALRLRDADTGTDAASAGHAAAPALSLLTLGHCIPMLALLPRSGPFREELAQIASHPGLTWCDFSSPGDWGSFAMVDPVKECHIAVAHPQPDRPLLRSPRFHTMFAPETYALVKRDKRRLHLQYLMTGDLPADYDYFAITSGPLTLAQRYPADASAP